MPTKGPRSETNVYRDQLIALEQKAQGEFDRAVMALSGGALGVTFAFLDTFLGGRTPTLVGWLVASWFSWALSLSLVLASHYFSTLAMRKAIDQHDEGKLESETAGGFYDTAIKWLNAMGGLSFIAGVVAAGIFVFDNV